MIDATFSFEDQKAYSLFAIDRLTNIEALLVVDSAVPLLRERQWRFIHLSPDAPAFDVVTDKLEDPLFASRSFKQATTFQEINADRYSFRVRNAGEATEILAVKDVDILPGGYYTMIIRGFVNPPDGNTNVLSMEIR